MERPPSEVAQRAFESLRETSVAFPATVFQLGASFADLPRPERALDARERLALGALLRPTPPRWVHIEDFSIAARPVTNGEYLRFVEDPGYEDAARWQRVFEDHAPSELDHYALAHPDEGDERLRETRETYLGTRSFLVALVRSIVFEVERDLDLSPRYSEKRSVWEEARPIDRPRSNEIAWTAALLARALGPYLSPEHRRELLPEDRERLTALDLEAGPPRSGSASSSSAVPRGAPGPAWREALEALDAVIGRVRDRHLESLKSEGPGRVAAEFERGLVERDYAAPDFQIASLKVLDRLRAAHARASSEGERASRVPLRRLLYPLTWPGDDPRPLLRDRPDRLPWAERPVTGVSLYEALAYADWLTRAAGGRALVRLPSEAQVERASSWPLVSRKDAIDRRWKVLFPWESRAADDPAQVPQEQPLRTWAQLGGERGDPFERDRRELDELVRRTARPVGEKRLEMLQGFQWEWTRDRVSDLEPSYEHLGGAEPLAASECPREPGASEPVPAVHYAGAKAPSAWFAARGAPDRLGASALTTRRFGFYPLRGAPEIGFRLVLEPGRRASVE